MNKAELEEKLSRLPGWEARPPQGAMNAYKCNSCFIVAVTFDLDRGTTPMFMGCKVTEGCHGVMHSSGYPTVDVPPGYLEDKKVFEWYRPEANALGLFHELPDVDQYIRDGGLLLRERKAESGN